MLGQNATLCRATIISIYSVYVVMGTGAKVQVAMGGYYRFDCQYSALQSGLA